MLTENAQNANIILYPQKAQRKERTVTNRVLFKVALLEKGYTSETLAKEVGMSATTLSYKVNNKRKFTASEIQKVSKVLGLNPDRIMEIFFAEDVD